MFLFLTLSKKWWLAISETLNILFLILIREIGNSYVEFTQICHPETRNGIHAVYPVIMHQYKDSNYQVLVSNQICIPHGRPQLALGFLHLLELMIPLENSLRVSLPSRSRSSLRKKSMTRAFLWLIQLTYRLRQSSKLKFCSFFSCRWQGNKETNWVDCCPLPSVFKKYIMKLTLADVYN